MSRFAGVYDYRGGVKLAILPKNGSLVAILDEALYPLKWVKDDEFRNGGGQPVTFRRSADGRIEGVIEGQDYFSRLSESVPADVTTMALAAPRPGNTYAYQAPPSLNDGLRVGPASASGFDVAALEQVMQAIISEKYPQVHSMLLWRKGKLVLEEYFYGYDRDRPHQIRSATKSFISTLAGLAIRQGGIRGEHQPIFELLPWPADSIANPDPRKKRITLGDLLSMRSGLDCDDRNSASPGNDSVVYQQADWARYTIDLPMVSDPGTTARYASASPYLASRLIEHATGQDLLAFAESKLFAPLGFKNHRWPHQTVRGNEGTFAQLYIRPRDFLKYGILYLEGGRWEGTQLVPKDWVERSTQPLTKIGSKTYGYFWWHQIFSVKTREGSREIDSLLATGNGGQKLFIVPSLGLVAVFTGGNYGAQTDTPPNEIMAKAILPQISGD